MEDVLDLYHEPYDEKRPVICFDESSKALRGHKRDPLPANRERSHASTPATNAMESSGFTLPRNR
jgi:5'-3' exonuclease